jgi:hypothetical protein
VDHLALAIGTTKGLFFVSDGTIDGPVLTGDPVGAFAQLDERFLAAVTRSGRVKLLVSDNGGLSWQEPSAKGLALPEGSGPGLEQLWQLHVDRRPTATGTIWAGAEPAALFRSKDGGESFELVRGLFEHPDRASWRSGPCGLGLHTVVTHPERPNRLVVAISSGGIYRSDDGGESWVACNNGMDAQATPGSSEASRCVHKLAVDAGDPDFVWAQTHAGIYRTEDAGDHWATTGHTGEPNGLPSDFGFPVVSHPEEPSTAFVLPLESAVYRCTAGGRCRVFRTTDGGRRWEALAEGLPGPDAHMTVLRDAFAIASEPPYPLAFGSKSGHVFASLDSGDSWRLVASYLPPILCVRVLV